MLIEKMLERRTSNDNNPTHPSILSGNLPFVLMLLFVLYIIWKQQQDLIKEMRLKNSKSAGFQIPVNERYNRIYFNPREPLLRKNQTNSNQMRFLN